MANVRAFRSGLWSDTNPATSPWGTGGVLYAPASDDIVYSNSHTIHVDQNITVIQITNAASAVQGWKDGGSAAALIGGVFNLFDGIIATTNIAPRANGGLIVSLSGTNSATIIGNGTIPSSFSTTYIVLHSSSGTLNFTGNIDNSGGFGGNNDVVGVQGIRITNASGVLNFTGNVFAGRQTANHGISNASSGTVNFTGNVYGLGFTSTLDSAGASYGINNQAGGFVNVIGNVYGGIGTSVGLWNNLTGRVSIIGNLIADSRGGAGLAATNAAAPITISGNIINAPNGVAAIYAPSFRYDPVPQDSYIRHARNGIGLGDDAYLYQVTTDSLSALQLPLSGDVRFGTTYGDPSSPLSGACVIPPTSAVVAGVDVDGNIGTASLDISLIDYNKMFDTLVSEVTGSNSIGIRLKNTATLESVGRIIASFSR